MSNKGFNERSEDHGKVKIITFKNNEKAKENLIEYESKKTKKRQDFVGKKKKRKKKVRFKKSSSKDFYKSREWYELRYRVLRVYKAKCMCCGRSPQEHGISVHVDHIKPRSKYPKLELNFDNMQVLCAACNLGKSNIDNTDWRALSNNDIFLIKQSQKMG